MNPDTPGIPGSGGAAEELAAEHLRRAGYRVLQRNYRSRVGEIDIVAADGDILCFIEVKFRMSTGQGHPLESVTPAKQRKISLTALSYLQEAQACDDRTVRFDVVAITLTDELCEIQLVKNAFDSRV